jgi:multicomponent Na+:H+ antiporter subunit G
VLLGLLVGVCLLISLIFNCLGVVSLYRFPDAYTRLHGATKCSTFGTLFAVFGLLLYSFTRFLAEEGVESDRFLVLFIHTAIAAVVLLISNPTGAHALARAAHRSGVLPYPAVTDSLEEAEKRKGGVTA